MSVILATWEDYSLRSAGQIVCKTSSPKESKQNDWRCGSTGRVPANEAEFKPHSHKKKKKSLILYSFLKQ
jgi:hypothetical protein